MKKKILITYSGKEGYGGIYSFFKLLLPELEKKYDITFFSVTEKIPKFNTILKSMPSWLKKISFKYNLHNFISGFYFLKYIKIFKKYDKVIYNQANAFPSALFLNTNKLNILHGSCKSCSQAWWKERRIVYWLYYKIFTFFEFLSGNCCDKVLTVSDLSKVNLKKSLIYKPVINCGLGLDEFKFEDINEKIINFSDKDFLLVFSGRFDIGKGSDKMIKVMKKMSNSYPNIKLLCVSKKTNNWQELIKYNIFFYEDLSDYDLHSIYSLANLMLFPSRYEGFGLSPAEGLKYGLPLIYTKTGFGYSLINKNIEGIYINETNENEDIIIKQILLEYKKKKKYDFSDIDVLYYKNNLKKWLREIN